MRRAQRWCKAVRLCMGTGGIISESSGAWGLESRLAGSFRADGCHLGIGAAISVTSWHGVCRSAARRYGWR